MSFSVRLLALLSVYCTFAAVSLSGAVAYNFTFFDGDGGVIGTGDYAFDDIAPETTASFDALTNLSWRFDLPPLGVEISSAAGDSTTRESTTDEGVVITGGGANLQFFDDIGLYVSHNDESATLRTSVRFVEFTNEVEYIVDDVTVDIGTYSVVAVAEPSAAMPVAIGAVACLLFRRRMN